MIFDDTVCHLGEGPLWHPERKSLLWFDILNMRLYERGMGDASAKKTQFNEHVSAAGWIDKDRILIASESALFIHDFENGKRDDVVPLEADNSATRSNDGRADAQGGFWIGTMSKTAASGQGAIYRFYRGELRKLYPGISIPNSICFAPDGKRAYFCDTATNKIMQVGLDADGWPQGEAEVFADVAPHNPDGSVVDGVGNLWNAQWGSNRIARYDATGQFMDEIKFDAAHVSCPAFGGDDFKTLFATTATEHMQNPGKADGLTFALSGAAEHGRAEHQVIIG